MLGIEVVSLVEMSKYSNRSTYYNAAYVSEIATIWYDSVVLVSVYCSAHVIFMQNNRQKENNNNNDTSKVTYTHAHIHT